ncbi:hypothetical protein CHARACLAT_008672 [Characodon lateralis]|uniref:Regulator of microtubule dynamics protein 2 n=1 Tax=Characodon lateralis TaxID=208331 RepID=A0ABU7DPL2_9TELE|nr:hypothetical protein [Characodon lateralis]
MGQRFTFQPHSSPKHTTRATIKWSTEIALRLPVRTSPQVCRMAQTDNKVLVLGALAGVAGIGLAVVCYRGLSFKRRVSWSGFYHNRTNEQGSGLMLVDGPELPRGQAEVLERLEALIQCVSELKEEMKALKTALPALPDQVREELKGHSEARRLGAVQRTTATRRKRTAGTVTTAEGQSSEDAESEGGYMTALTDSEEDESDEEERAEEQTQDGLSVLLDRIDRLRQGSESDKRESLNILLEQRDEFGQKSEFLWRLTRAYCDVHDVSITQEEKKTYAENGNLIPFL